MRIFRGKASFHQKVVILFSKKSCPEGISSMTGQDHFLLLFGIGTASNYSFILRLDCSRDFFI